MRANGKNKLRTKDIYIQKKMCTCISVCVHGWKGWDGMRWDGMAWDGMHVCKYEYIYIYTYIYTDVEIQSYLQFQACVFLQVDKLKSCKYIHVYSKTCLL